MWAGRLVLGLLLLLAGTPTAADRVVPSERVRSRVNVRELPERGSRVLGRLAVGEEAKLLESLPGWHRVALPGETEGFVSADWTRIVEIEPQPALTAAPLPPAPRPGLLERLAYGLGRVFGRQPPISIEVEEPDTERTFLRHPDPRMPVSGFATAAEGGLVELILAIDASTSTNEFSEADVDGDGELEDTWAGDDSIYQAQVLAARRFVDALGRLPGNREGERIRVGIITFSGVDAYREYPPDEDFDPTPISILGLANRDAQLRIALTGDYAAVDRTLEELAKTDPVGMTNFAAAIGRALIELEGLAAMGADERPREGALRVVSFLTDGMPSLPYARKEAEKAARYAALLARDSGIRINVFELGENAVTRKSSKTAARMAQVTGGTLVEVDRPGDIVEVLSTTSLAFVDRVRLANRTTGEQTRYIWTGVDGSFYGEVPLREGENRISVVAVLQDGREKEVELEVDYTRGLPTPELEKRLTLVREKNESLIEEIRAQLAKEMDTQRKQLDVSAGAEER
jgi:hypothetical protein